MNQHVPMKRLQIPRRNNPLASAVREAAAGGTGPSLEDVTNQLGQIASAFEEFKAANDKRLDDISNKKGDVLNDEKVDRIEASLQAFETELERQSQVRAAIGAVTQETESDKYSAAFRGWMQNGVDANLIGTPQPRAALETQSDPDGGFLVPEQMETTVSRIQAAVTVMRNISQVMTISSGVYKKPVNLGGATSGWVGEKAARPETSTPQLSELSFPAHEIYAMPNATQTMLDDASVDVEGWLAGEVATEFMEEEGNAFVDGDGVNKPRGFTSYDKVANSSYAWGKLGYIASGVAASLTDGSNNGIDALIDLQYALKQGYRPNARWVMNRTTTGVVRKLKDANDAYHWQPSTALGEPATFLGHPVSVEDYMADVGADAYPIAFGDFQRGYLIVDRVGIRVLRDPYTNKPYIQFYTTKRVGGGVQMFEAIKLLKVATS